MEKVGKKKIATESFKKKRAWINLKPPIKKRAWKVKNGKTRNSDS
jgi:hypothetical protein